MLLPSMSLGLTNHGFVKDPLLVRSSILLKKSWYQTSTTFFIQDFRNMHLVCKWAKAMTKKLQWLRNPNQLIIDGINSISGSGLDDL